MAPVPDLAVELDKYAVPATQALAFIGLLWITLKIFSFWRLIASLFILPGISVRSNNLHHCIDIAIY
jgi:17beta-estradiol 17-dehydrogenase / very-long-chain 3-oxoacyl-CoA reductase